MSAKLLSAKNNLRGKNLQISCDAVLDPPPCSQLQLKLALQRTPSWLNTTHVLVKQLTPEPQILASFRGNYPKCTKNTHPFPSAPFHWLILPTNLHSFLTPLVSDDVSCNNARLYVLYWQFVQGKNCSIMVLAKRRTWASLAQKRGIKTTRRHVRQVTKR